MILHELGVNCQTSKFADDTKLGQNVSDVQGSINLQKQSRGGLVLVKE